MPDQADDNPDEDVFELTKMVRSVDLSSSRVSHKQDQFGLSILRGEFEEFSKGETYLLYRIFEELNSVKNDTSDTALWHAFDESLLNSFSVEPLHRSSISSEGVSTTTAHESSYVKTITFSELNNRANQLARILRRSLKDHGANIGPESLRDADLLYKTPSWSYERMQVLSELENLQQKTIIAIFMPPGIDRVVTQIACMKLHLAYLPLDRQQPASKIIELIETVRPISVIIDPDYFENADDLLVGYAQDQAMASKTSTLGAYLDQNRKRTTGLSSQLRGDLVSRARLMEVISEFGVLFYDSLCSVAEDLKISEANLSITTPDAKNVSFTECLFPAVPDPMLLLLFSSGTTSNQQKGVRLSHKQMYNRLKWQWSCQEVGPCGQMDMSTSSYDLSSNSFEIGLCKTAWLFVDSFTELFSMILVGLPCVLCGNSKVPSEAITADVFKFAHLCFQFQITRVSVVPAVLKSWLCQIEASAKNELDSLLNQLSSLTTVVCSGDTLSSQLAKKFFQLFKQGQEYPDKVLVNLYGSTEVAGDVSFCVYHNLEEVEQLTTSDLEGGKPAQSYLSIGDPINNVEIYIVSPVIDTKRSDSKSSDELDLEEFEERDKSSRVRVCAKDTVGEIAVAGLAICQKFHTYWGYKLEDDLSAPTSRKISDVLRSPVVARSSVFSNFSPPIKERKTSPHSPFQKTPFVFNSIRISKPELERLYLTGDRGFISSRDNKLYIVGRSDDMIKVNGVLCNASSVDLLIAEVSARSPEFSCIETSKTIGIQVPGNRNRLVCFYTLKNDTTETCLDSNDNRVLGLQIGTTYENKFQAAMLAELVNNHLSVFITPVFIQLDHMPYQRVSGKVDKARLRTFYLSRACELAIIPSSNTRHSFFNRNKKDSTSNIMSRNYRPRSASFDFLSPMAVKNKQEINNISRREMARGILKRVLGQNSKLSDDDDFYALGGDSLAVVEAVCELRRADFPASVHLFATTGRIGDLLSDLEHKLCVINEDHFGLDKSKPTYHKRGSLKKRGESLIPGLQLHLVVSDWIIEPDNADCLSMDQLVTYVVDCFLKRDRITKAFNLSKRVLNTVVNSYVASHMKQPGLILVANSSHVSKPLGIVIALPSFQMPVVPVADPCWESFENLMELCASCNDSNLDTGSELSILMLAADSANELEDLDSGESGRLVMETLATLERTVINRATTLGYSHITTVNTNPVTQAICAELGYRQKNAISLGEFCSGNYSSRVMIAKEHHDVTCYFMTKELID